MEDVLSGIVTGTASRRDRSYQLDTKTEDVDGSGETADRGRICEDQLRQLTAKGSGQSQMMRGPESGIWAAAADWASRGTPPR